MSNLLVQSDADKEILAPLRGLARVADRRYPVGDIEVRAEGEGSTKVNFYGHASVTGKGYDMYGGPGSTMGGWTEYVDKGAFKKTLKERADVAFLANHAGLTLARTAAGSLKLAEDEVGLEVRAQLDTRVSTVNDIVVLMEGGELTEMSFAFRIIRQVWLNEDGEEVPWWDLSGIERHIKEVSLDKGDVSVVNYGANPFTDATLRSLDAVVRIRAALAGEEPPVETESGERAVDGAVSPSFYENLRRLHDLNQDVPAA